MKHRLQGSFAGLVLAGFVSLCHAAASGDASGSGGWTAHPCNGVGEAERAEIQARIDHNIAMLAAQGRLPAASLSSVQLAWPLRATFGPSDFGFHAIFSFVDHDPNFPNAVLDYNCGNRTYDNGFGYNHRGTDIGLWPLAWNRVADGSVEVVAAADGVIIDKKDGFTDLNCVGVSGNGNSVFVRHGDGSITWYVHMKNGSLTTKNVGDAVVTGERLGIVASSGNSWAPHLHFELYDGTGTLVDPWQGPCNPANPVSWWAAQPPYLDSAINKLMTSSAEMVTGACPNPDVTNESLFFEPGDTIYFYRFYRDLLNGQTSVCKIFRPDGSEYATWNSTSTQDNTVAWMMDWRIFGGTQPFGKWRFEVTYAGKTYNHDFWMMGAGPWLLRNARLTSIAPLSMPLSSIFVASGATTLDLDGLDATPQAGEGDDDDAYVAAFVSGQQDPDGAVVINRNRPLIFYQVDGVATPLRLVKSGAGGLALHY